MPYYRYKAIHSLYLDLVYKYKWQLYTANWMIIHVTSCFSLIILYPLGLQMFWFHDLSPTFYKEKYPS